MLLFFFLFLFNFFFQRFVAVGFFSLFQLHKSIIIQHLENHEFLRSCPRMPCALCVPCYYRITNQKHHVIITIISFPTFFIIKTVRTVWPTVHPPPSPEFPRPPVDGSHSKTFRPPTLKRSSHSKLTRGKTVALSGVVKPLERGKPPSISE
jgi:hypothetical protein